MNSEDLSTSLYAVTGVLHRILVHVVSKHAKNIYRGLDAGTALSHVLMTHIPYICSNFKSYHKTELFHPHTKVIISKIDIELLDNSLLIDIAFIPGFIVILLQHKCIEKNHQSCCSTCNHYSTVCNKCTSTGVEHAKCNHKCLTCSVLKVNCSKQNEICCTKCNRCRRCNQYLYQQQQQLKRQPQQQNPPQQQQQACHFFAYIYSLMMMLDLRNLTAHLTAKKCDEFLNNKIPLKGFPICQNWKELRSVIEYAFDRILFYLGDLHNLNDPLTEDQQIDCQAELRVILHQSKEKIRKLFTHYIQNVLNEKLQREVNVPKMLDIEFLIEDIVRHNFKVDTESYFADCIEEVSKDALNLFIKDRHDQIADDSKLRLTSCGKVNHKDDKFDITVTIDIKFDSTFNTEAFEDRKSPESMALKDLIKKNIKSLIKKEINIDVDVTITRYKYGSLILDISITKKVKTSWTPNEIHFIQCQVLPVISEFVNEEIDFANCTVTMFKEVGSYGDIMIGFGISTHNMKLFNLIKENISDIEKGTCFISLLQISTSTKSIDGVKACKSILEHLTSRETWYI